MQPHRVSRPLWHDSSSKSVLFSQLSLENGKAGGTSGVYIMSAMVLPFLPYFSPFHPQNNKSPLLEPSPITPPTKPSKTPRTTSPQNIHSPSAMMAYFHRASSKSSVPTVRSMAAQSNITNNDNNNNNTTDNTKPTPTCYIPPYTPWETAPPSAIAHAAKTTTDTSPTPSSASSSLENFFLSSRYSDMIITCRGGREFNVHRVVACAHSPVIEAAVSRICEVCIVP